MILTDEQLVAELRRIVVVIQAKRLSIFNAPCGEPPPINNKNRQLWLDLLDVEFYALEALTEMGEEI